MLLGIPRSARCVQRFDDSLNSAIHITYRISLRSSSMREPRDPLLKVVCIFPRFKSILDTFIGCESIDNKESRLSHSNPQEKGLQVCAQWEKTKKRAHALEAPATALIDSIMILPQVHLRKPCYDFYFL